MSYSFNRILVRGPDTASFLQGQLCGDVRLLDNSDQKILTACCNPKGRMIANFYLSRQDEAFIVELPSSMCDIFMSHLNKYAAFSKVELSKENTDIENTPEQQLENYEQGIAFITPETTELFLPQMLNLEKFNGLSFKKGCFVGQEIIARTQHLGKLKRHLYRFESNASETLNVGDTIKNNNDEPIGTVVSTVSLDNNNTGYLAVIEDRSLDTLTPKPIACHPAT